MLLLNLINYRMCSRAFSKCAKVAGSGSVKAAPKEVKITSRRRNAFQGGKAKSSIPSRTRRRAPRVAPASRTLYIKIVNEELRKSSWDLRSSVDFRNPDEIGGLVATSGLVGRRKNHDHSHKRPRS